MLALPNVGKTLGVITPHYRADILTHASVRSIVGELGRFVVMLSI
jgi:hypothetical protein